MITKMSRKNKSIWVCILPNGNIKISWKHPADNMFLGLLHMGLITLLLWVGYAIFPAIKAVTTDSLSDCITLFTESGIDRISCVFYSLYGIIILLLFL